MTRGRAWRAALALLLLLATACAPAAGPPAASAGQAAPADSGLDTVQQAYVLLSERSVDQPNSATLLGGALAGARLEVMRAGIAAPVVASPTFTGDPNRDWPLFGQALAAAVTGYRSKVPPERMARAAIAGMAAAVDDCHTSYLDPAAYAEQVQLMQGTTRFGGIGATLRRPSPADPLVIWHVYDGTPAAKAGLRAGDAIAAIDGRSTSDLSVEGAVALIRGAEGTTVRLTISRYGAPAPLEVPIVRGQVSPPAVEAALLSNGVGYLRLSSFTDSAPTQVAQALDWFDQQGARAWVFDLRNNGGGSLQAEEQTLSKLIPRGLLFYVWDRDGKRTDYQPDASYRGGVKPLTVLVNGGTGSGGEVFAAAIQDYHLGTVVGERTAGCVGTARVYRLPDGSGLQVTEGKLFTGVSNRMLNRIGVTPDAEVAMSLQDLIEGRDPQLAAAVRLVSP